ncbi:galactose-specific lectin nattectin-like isoform X1 [Haliotis cracherodii]|uniref:galactose-specific lectin nattectin-like isoform X1 n=1 Tax=Haliotis cracherodii TaxID=6455 RepID=UPI0039EADFDB
MMFNTIFSSTLLLCLAHAVVAVCPDGWTKYDTSCYALYQGKTAWIEAGSFCREFGGNLATLNTTDKVKNVKAFLNYVNHKASAWVGGNDLRSEGMWVWDIDQASFTNTDWQPGQPDSKVGEEDCLLLHQPSSFKWHDATCTSKYDYLCERRSTSAI